jgi:hypothetical protein
MLFLLPLLLADPQLSGRQLIVALSLFSSPAEPSSSCTTIILLYLSHLRGEDEGKDDLQPDPDMTILLLFDARCSCAVIVIANEAVVEISSTRVAIVAAPPLSSS